MINIVREEVNLKHKEQKKFLTPDELKKYFWIVVVQVVQNILFVHVHLKYIDNNISKISFRCQLHTLKTITLMVTNFVTHQQLEYKYGAIFL